MTTQVPVVPRLSPPPRGQTGFALVTVLIAVSVIMSYVASYGRHVIVEGR
jgi:Tfp pilus assembly protein PilX